MCIDWSHTLRGIIIASCSFTGTLLCAFLSRSTSLSSPLPVFALDQIAQQWLSPLQWVTRTFCARSECNVPPERAATSHTPDRSLIASRTCDGPRGRNLAAAACVLGPERCSSWNMCCPGLLTLVNLRDKKRRRESVRKHTGNKEQTPSGSYSKRQREFKWTLRA